MEKKLADDFQIKDLGASKHFLGMEFDLEHFKGRLFKKHDHLNVEMYTDTVWACSTTDRRSTSGILHFCWRKSCYLAK